MSNSSLLGSLGCSSNSFSASRGKMGFSWVSPAEGLYMSEKPRLLDSPVGLIEFTQFLSEYWYKKSFI